MWQPLASAKATSEKMSATDQLISNQIKKHDNQAVVDVQNVTIEKPDQAILDLNEQKAAKATTKAKCDILIVGGGIGGVAAALQASKSGLSVVLTEETDWLGGQMTSQGVSALDENYMVEESGACLSYQNFRLALRKYYQTNYKLTDIARQQQYLNPGDCWVTWLSFEPKVALAKINELLQPAIDTGNLKVFLRTKAISVEKSGSKIQSVQLVNLDSKQRFEFAPKICLDATELGDILPLAGVNYRTGAESCEVTGEPHAPVTANPDNVQDFTYPFVVELRENENHTIAKPPHYDEFNSKGKFSFDGYQMFNTVTKIGADGKEKPLMPFWEYRRLIAKDNFADSRFATDLAMINWDSNDLRGENIIDQTAQTEAERLALGKAVSLGFLYWLQTEAPRDDGGKGYPELMLRTDILDTKDGLSKYPYIRESRRIVACETVVEQDIAYATTFGARARNFSDSVGIGLYPIDIHGKQDVPGAGQKTRPFQLPLGALIPTDAVNLIPACKNIGVTHVTNGAYRLHPIEWAIGQAAGALACYAITSKKSTEKVWRDNTLTRNLQKILIEDGTPVYWYDDVPTDHNAFAAIQYLSVAGIMKGSDNDLHFRPDETATRGEAASVLFALLHHDLHYKVKHLPPDIAASDPQQEAIGYCLDKQILAVNANGEFGKQEALSKSDLETAASLLPKAKITSNIDNLVSRQNLALWAYEIATSKKYMGRL
jgi:hypothetical protein